jgi:hypothetical protein
MAQLISYMSKAVGVTPATSNTATGVPTAGDATTNNPAAGTYPPVTAVHEAQTVTVRSVLDVSSAATGIAQLSAGDILVGCMLPANHVPVDLMLLADDLDTGANLTLTPAVLKQDFTDIVASTSFLTGSTVGQAGGVARANVVDGLKLKAATYDRWIGIKIAVGGAQQAAAAMLELVFSYRAAYGE